MMTRLFDNLSSSLSGDAALRIVLFFLLSVSLTSIGYTRNADDKKLHLLSTIKPIYLLVNGIAGERADSSLLIPETMNTHHYSFRPSDLRKLANADVIIRISKHRETFLNTLLKQEKRVISLDKAPRLQWLKIRAHGHDHHGEARDGEKKHEDEHENEHSNEPFARDYHIWLNPQQTLLLVSYITQQLSKIDPINAKYYTKNSKQLQQQIRDADEVARKKLLPVKNFPYLVFHDGWHYLEEAYGLAKPQTISLHEGLPPGLKTVYKLRQQIKNENIHCLIASPNSNKRLISTLVEDLPIQTLWLNPIGSAIPDNTYPAFIQYNAEQFAHCLQ